MLFYFPLYIVAILLLSNTALSAQNDTIRSIHSTPSRAGIGDVLRVQVDDSTVYNIRNGTLNYQHLSIVLNGVHFQNLHPEFIFPNTLAFLLTYNSATSSQWKLLLGTQRAAKLPVEVRVSSADMKIFTPSGYTRFFTLMLYRSGWQLTAILTVTAVIALFLLLIFTSSVIREPVPVPTAGTPQPASLPPYSLARFQMALWFLVIFASFIYLVLLTGEWNGIINQTALILMGLGAAPVLSNNLIDTSTDSINTGLFPSRGFLKDIVSDSGGIRLSRVQQLVWTVTFIVMFIVNVLEDFSLPIFDTNTLLLMGISSGTYVALRPFERL